MKFKAKLSLEHTQLLYNLILPISKLTATTNTSNDDSTTNKSILFLDNDKLVLSTRGSSQKPDSEGIFTFAELITRDGIFHNHVIDSIETDNAILMEVCLGQFKTALKGVLDTQKEVSMSRAGTSSYSATLVSQGMHEVSIKLAKRNGGLPHLCFDVKDATSSLFNSNPNTNAGSGGIGVNYAVPVRIMRVDELQYHVPPRLGMPDLQLELPRDRPLRNVVERLRGIAPQLYLEGCMQKGILTLRMDGEGASVRTSFNKLVPIHEDCKSSQSQTQLSQKSEGESQHSQHSQNENQIQHEHNNEESTQTQTQTQTQEGPTKCTVKVDSRKLHASLHWQASLGIRDVSTAVLCMWENEMLVLDVTLNPEIGRFMYYVPCQYMSADEL